MVIDDDFEGARSLTVRDWDARIAKQIQYADEHRDLVPGCYAEVLQNFPSSCTVLVPGCGFANFEHLLSRYHKVYAFDYVPSYVEKALRECPDNCEVFLDNLLDLKFDGHADVAITKTVLQHIPPKSIAVAIEALAKRVDAVVMWESTAPRQDPKVWPHDYPELFAPHGFKEVLRKPDSYEFRGRTAHTTLLRYDRS